MVRGQGQGKIRVGLGLGLMVGFGLLSDRAQATTPMATVEAIAPRSSTPTQSILHILVRPKA